MGYPLRLHRAIFKIDIGSAAFSDNANPFFLRLPFPHQKGYPGNICFDAEISETISFRLVSDYNPTEQHNCRIVSFFAVDHIESIMQDGILY